MSARVQFDSQFLDAYTGGDNETRDQVLKLFLVQSHMLLGRLEDALGNPPAWGEAAHFPQGLRPERRRQHGRRYRPSKPRPRAWRKKTCSASGLSTLKSALEATAAQVQALIHKA